MTLTRWIKSTVIFIALLSGALLAQINSNDAIYGRLLGTGVGTALAINVGSAGAFTTFNGAGGTPSSITLTNGTGLPISTGVSGLGTGVATWAATPSWTNLSSAMTGTAAILPSSAGCAPTTNAQQCYDTTQNVWSVGSGSENGHLSVVRSVTHVNAAKTNTTTADQDYASVYTIAANRLIAGKSFFVTLMFQYASSSSAVSQQVYLKLGSTKVVTQAATWTPANSVTRGISFQFLINGTAAAGATANVDSGVVVGGTFGNASNATAQPVALATNGTLTIVPGMAFGATGSADTLTLLDAAIEEIN